MIQDNGAPALSAAHSAKVVHAPLALPPYSHASNPPAGVHPPSFGPAAGMQLPEAMTFEVAEAQAVREERIGATEMTADWCAPGSEPIVGGGCLAPSARPRQPLIVYLHGRYARDLAGDEIDRQRRLAVRATSRGFAVLALRGR